MLATLAGEIFYMLKLKIRAYNFQENNFPIWLGLWVPLLAMAWLLPNHYYPWATFHSDAWVAVMFVPVAIVLVAKTPTQVEWHFLPVLFAALSALPFIQFAGGMLPFSGQAWLASLYIFGLALSLLIGATWERAYADKAPDGIFFAIGIASFASVYLQLRQWTGLAREFEDIQFWVAEFSADRPSANLAQPNQLATLLIWGLLSCAWAVARNKVRPIFAVLAVLFLLFGITLTQSRMAMVVLSFITCASWFWRRTLPKPVPKTVTLLFLYFLMLTFALQSINDLFNIESKARSASFGGESTGLRLNAYLMFLGAVKLHPWFGYGWSRLAVAQLTVAQDHPYLMGFFLHSHNLILDLILWCGIPLGLFVAGCLAKWLIFSMKMVRDEKDVILIIFVIGVGIHAMLELPLHHAYFLLPTGLVMGIVTQRASSRILLRSNRWLVATMLIFTACVLGAVIRDYLQVDESFRAYRLEMNHVGNLPPVTAPSVYLLNDMSEFIGSLRTEVKPDINDVELSSIKSIALSFPTPANLFNYARALAFRHRSIEAEQWLRKIVKVVPGDFVEKIRLAWATEAKTQPAIAAVPWPVDN